MRLNSGTPPWRSTLQDPPTYPVLEDTIHCDCLVVGAGMGGAMASYRLSLSGAEAVLIEKDASEAEAHMPILVYFRYLTTNR